MACGVSDGVSVSDVVAALTNTIPCVAACGGLTQECLLRGLSSGEQMHVY